MYHERQHLMHCAMHALNNLFQEGWADRVLMERLSLELCDREAALRSESGMRRMLINPFKSVVPFIGDYDISVVIEALKLRDCRVSLHVVFNPRNPSAFELALAEVDWESASVTGIIVNFVCRNLLWGTWITHHFYAIVKGPDTLEGAAEVGEGTPGAEGGGIVTAAEVEARSIEDGRGSGGGVGRGGSGESDDEEGRGGCLKRLTPVRRRAAHPRDGSGEGVSGDGDGGGGVDGEGAERATGAVWYSLDSRLPKPQRLGGKRQLLAHLAWEVREHHGHVFVVGKGVEAADECSDGHGQTPAAV